MMVLPTRTFSSFPLADDLWFSRGAVGHRTIRVVDAMPTGRRSPVSYGSDITSPRQPGGVSA